MSRDSFSRVLIIVVVFVLVVNGVITDATTTTIATQIAEKETSPTEVQPKNVPCLSDSQFYRDPGISSPALWSADECSKYYLCLDNEVFEFKCSQGLTFDVAQQICNFVSKVENCDLVMAEDEGGPEEEPGDEQEGGEEEQQQQQQSDPEQQQQQPNEQSRQQQVPEEQSEQPDEQPEQQQPLQQQQPVILEKPVESQPQEQPERLDEGILPEQQEDQEPKLQPERRPQRLPERGLERIPEEPQQLMVQREKRPLHQRRPTLQPDRRPDNPEEPVLTRQPTEQPKKPLVQPIERPAGEEVSERPERRSQQQQQPKRRPEQPDERRRESEQPEEEEVQEEVERRPQRQRPPWRRRPPGARPYAERRPEQAEEEEELAPMRRPYAERRPMQSESRVEQSEIEEAELPLERRPFAERRPAAQSERPDLPEEEELEEELERRPQRRPGQPRRRPYDRRPYERRPPYDWRPERRPWRRPGQPRRRPPQPQLSDDDGQPDYPDRRPGQLDEEQPDYPERRPGRPDRRPGRPGIRRPERPVEEDKEEEEQVPKPEVNEDSNRVRVGHSQKKGERRVRCGKGKLACPGTAPPRCMPGHYLCDGHDDCSDGSDESLCDLYNDPFAASPCDKVNCELPNCWCSDDGSEIPANLSTPTIPQMITITFEDAVNSKNFDNFAKLFTEERKNPNNCPIQATFFVSHRRTNYRDVQHLWNLGHEIAVHSITHREPPSWWTFNATIEDWFDEMIGQANILNRFAAVRLRDIRGMRSPFLRIGWHRQFLMMSEFGFAYDSSIIAPPSYPPIWPYTLDYQIPHDCSAGNQACPTRAYPGLWEIPINPLLVENDYCVSIEKCPLNLTTEEIYGIMMNNFKIHYSSNRAPLGLHFQSSWVEDPDNFAALSKFIDDVLRFPDVYFVTNQQVLEWIRNPRTLDTVHTFEPWLCLDKKLDADEIVCDLPNSCRLESRLFRNYRYLHTCFDCPKHFPWLRNEFGNNY